MLLFSHLNPEDFNSRPPPQTSPSKAAAPSTQSSSFVSTASASASRPGPSTAAHSTDVHSDPATPAPRFPSHPTPSTPVGPFSSVASSQPRLRAKARSKWEKMDGIFGLIRKDLDGVGNFLELLLYHWPHGTMDPRTRRHETMVTGFLGGKSNPSPEPTADKHPGARSCIYGQGSSHGSILRTTKPIQLGIFLVGREARRQVGNLTKNPTDPADATQIRASTNGRAAVKKDAVATWYKLTENLSIPWVANKYKTPPPLSCTSPRSCPHPLNTGSLWLGSGAPTSRFDFSNLIRAPLKESNEIQVGTISSFVLARNRYANGYLALPLAVWQFTCKSHVDEKRIFTRFGLTVHDTTARACLDSLSETSLSQSYVHRLRRE
ncbi:hypothetical protein DFH09DRAFT_1107198 [Mycena vulgaris]|nr:hypothetical protein DFH09DRAFT_1107198 [Mycena vulgaris]